MSWVKGLVNLHQTPEQRREKYDFVRGLGLSSYHAKKMRDWRWSKLYRFFNIPNPFARTSAGQTQQLELVSDSDVA